MGLPLAEIVPWGRNRDEYERMFALTADDQQRRILDAGGEGKHALIFIAVASPGDDFCQWKTHKSPHISIIAWLILG